MTENQEWVDQSPGWILKYEEAFLEALTRTLPKDARLVNIGAGAGTSSAAMLRGGREIESFELLSIDNDGQILGEEVDYLESQGLYLQSRIRQYLGSSDEAFENISKGELLLNLVFVDGSHDGAQVLKDIQNFTGLITPGGILVCHDYGDPRQVSVTDAINEWHSESEWYVLGRAIFTVAFLKPGGNVDWAKGRIKELVLFSEPENVPEEEVVSGSVSNAPNELDKEVVQEVVQEVVKKDDPEVVVEKEQEDE